MPRYNLHSRNVRYVMFVNYFINAHKIRNISASKKLATVDPYDGSELDDDKEIRDYCENDRSNHRRYFERKEGAISNSYQSDLASAVWTNQVQANDIAEWKQGRDDMLEELMDQKSELEELTAWDAPLAPYSVPDPSSITTWEELQAAGLTDQHPGYQGSTGAVIASSSETQQSGQSSTVPVAASSSVTSAGTTVASSSGTQQSGQSSTGAAVASSSQGGNTSHVSGSNTGFAQDSSDVFPTTYDSSDYYEDY